MPCTKLFLALIFALTIKANLFSQQTVTTFDYQSINVGGTGCNTFANPMSISGFTHQSSFGWPYFYKGGIELGNSTSINSGYFNGTQFHISYQFKKFYHYKIRVYCRSYAQGSCTGCSLFSNIAIFLSDNTGGISSNYNCFTHGQEMNNSIRTNYIEKLAESTNFEWYTMYDGEALQPANFLLVAGFPQVSSAGISIVHIRKIEITETVPTTCPNPFNLSINSISNNSAEVTWESYTPCISSDIDYKAANTSSWINAVTGSVGMYSTISGLTPGQTYDWRIRTACFWNTGQPIYSDYVQSQFTTTNLPVCDAPTNLTQSNITNNSVTLNWAGVTNAVSYDVDFNYAPFNSGPWTNLSSGQTTTFLNVTGLNSNQWYTWRVRALCANGQYSNYVINDGYIHTNFQNIGNSDLKNRKLNENDFLTIYPNPVNNSLFLNFEKSKLKSKKLIEIINASGIKMFIQVIDSFNNIIAIDTHAFVNGLYTIKVTSESTVRFYKVLIKH